MNPDNTFNRPLSEIEIPPEGRVVHLHQYGFNRVFRVRLGYGETEYWVTDLLDASESERKRYKDQAWNIGEYHRGSSGTAG